MSEVGHVEATGAINFLALDELPVGHEGEPLIPDSVVQLPFVDGAPLFPTMRRDGTPTRPAKVQHLRCTFAAVIALSRRASASAESARP